MSLDLFIAVFGCVSSGLVERTYALLTTTLPTDTISRFGVSRIPRARLHRHGLGVIIRLGEFMRENTRECPWILNPFHAYYAGFVPYAHRDPRLHPEKPGRLLLDLLDGNAVRKCILTGFE